MKLFFLFFFPKTTKDLQSSVYLLVQEKQMNYKKFTLFLCSFEKLWAVMLTVESHVPRLPQGQTEQWYYSCQFGSQMRSKCPVKEKRHSVYTRWDWTLYVNESNDEGISYSFQMQGGRWETEHELYVCFRSLSSESFNCAFKETDGINSDAWAAYLYNNHMI